MERLGQLKRKLQHLNILARKGEVEFFRLQQNWLEHQEELLEARQKINRIVVQIESALAFDNKASFNSRQMILTFVNRESERLEEEQLSLETLEKTENFLKAELESLSGKNRIITDNIEQTNDEVSKLLSKYRNKTINELHMLKIKEN